MRDQQQIEAAIGVATGQAFASTSQRAIGGGCISNAVCITDGKQSFFVKTNSLEFVSAFKTEAQALREIAATRSIRVPEVIASVQGEAHAYLILEYIETGSSRVGGWRMLGEQLAALHSVRQPYFGWHEDNVIGATPQPNPRSKDWLEFFRTQRLEHQLKLCRNQGVSLPDGDRVLKSLDAFFADYQPYPALLHGDLWSGNVAFDANGQPFLFDPACYYGDREADLAYTEFFGGFAPAFYASYNASLPLDPGYAHRKTLYNLYHCLNHVVLFGSSYTRQAREMMRQLLQA